MFLSAVYGGPLLVHEKTEFDMFVDVLQSFCVDVSPKTDVAVLNQPPPIEYLVDNIMRGNIVFYRFRQCPSLAEACTREY
jgi:hypothetical protein